MCDHKPILLYDTGGTYYACSECGIMLGVWKPNTKKARYQREDNNSSAGIEPVLYGIIESPEKED